MRKFSREHEWVEINGSEVTVGITDYAQHALGDVVYAELPKVGRSVKQREETAVVESVKAASDVYAPVSGTVTAVNEALSADPSLVNRAAESDGWFFRLQVSDPAELDGLLDEQGYKDHINALG